METKKPIIKERCEDCGDYIRDCICDECICEIPFTGMNPDCGCDE